MFMFRNTMFSTFYVLCCLLMSNFVDILENHRLESSYQNHLILKVLVVSR